MPEEGNGCDHDWVILNNTHNWCCMCGSVKDTYRDTPVKAPRSHDRLSEAEDIIEEVPEALDDLMGEATGSGTPVQDWGRVNELLVKSKRWNNDEGRTP